jgi:hypothetical protein
LMVQFQIVLAGAATRPWLEANKGRKHMADLKDQS